MDSNKFWNSDKVVSSAAMLISIGTLFVLIYQTNLMSEQKRQSVLPYLLIGYHNTGTPNFKIVVENKGVGPAFIESVTTSYGDSTYQLDLPNFLYGEIDEMDSISNLFHSNIFEGLLIPAGESIPILQVDGSESDAERLLTLLRRLDAQGLNHEIVYKSIYNEK